MDPFGLHDAYSALVQSWWPDWHNWIAGVDDGKAAARRPGGGTLKVVEDAPGSYAAMTI